MSILDVFTLGIVGSIFAALILKAVWSKRVDGNMFCRVICDHCQAAVYIEWSRVRNRSSRICKLCSKVTAIRIEKLTKRVGG